MCLSFTTPTNEAVHLPAKPTRGLTLIELLIVIAVISVLVVIAAPGFVSARKAAEATKAIGRLKTLVTANEQYALRYRSYASSEADMVNAGLMADYSGSTAYTYAYSGTVYTWSVSAEPTTPGVTGDNYFYVDQSGVIRFSTTGVATPISTPVE